jgi:hypothetical protein
LIKKGAENKESPKLVARKSDNTIDIFNINETSDFAKSKTVVTTSNNNENSNLNIQSNVNGNNLQKGKKIVTINTNLPVTPSINSTTNAGSRGATANIKQGYNESFNKRATATHKELASKGTNDILNAMAKKNKTITNSTKLTTKKVAKQETSPKHLNSAVFNFERAASGGSLLEPNNKESIISTLSVNNQPNTVGNTPTVPKKEITLTKLVKIELSTAPSEKDNSGYDRSKSEKSFKLKPSNRFKKTAINNFLIPVVKTNLYEDENNNNASASSLQQSFKSDSETDRGDSVKVKKLSDIRRDKKLFTRQESLESKNHSENEDLTKLTDKLNTIKINLNKESNNKRDTITTNYDTDG